MSDAPAPSREPEPAPHREAGHAPTPAGRRWEPLIVRGFRVLAAIEALTWVGLLIGMFFKYVVVHDEIGVQIFGPLHGAAFVAYVLAALAVWRVRRWGAWTGMLSLAASIPPLTTVAFERWAARTGRLGPN